MVHQRCHPRSQSDRRFGSTPLGDDPAAALKLSRKLFRRDLAQRLFGLGESGGRCDLSSGAKMFGLFELLDEDLGLISGELAVRLSLGEPHRPAGIAEVDVSGVVEESEKLFDLPV